MKEDKSFNSSDILLGGLFLDIARAKIDVHDMTLFMKYNSEIVKFNVYDPMKCLDNKSCVFSVDI